jgi:hypothetical protein
MKKYLDDNEDGSVWSDEGLFCPHCKEEQEDLQEVDGAYTEDGGSTFCGLCNKEFEFSTFINYHYTSYRDR